MKKLASCLSLLLAGASAVWALDTPSTPQSARQALLEMFFSKTSGTFVKHLPAETLNTLEKSGVLASLQQYSTLAGQLHTKGKDVETFETGSILLSSSDPQTGQKFEIAVDSDSLKGEEDDIAISFRTYKDNQVQKTPFLPRMTFAMKMESGVWKLNEIQLTLRIPLADPDFLKGISEAMKARGAAATAMQPAGASPMSSFGGDAAVLAAMQTILKAENTYSSTYPSMGYTCTLSDLDGFGGGTPNEHQAMLIPSGLAGGKKYGYIFTLSGCSGIPATTFHLAAVPGVNNPGRRALCSDQTGAIRYSAEANAAACFASGTAAQ